MKKLSIKKLEDVLRDGLQLHNPKFRLERSGERIFGSIISSSFAGMRDHQRQSRIWDLLEGRFGRDSWRLVGMLLAFTPDEWNIKLEGHQNGHRVSHTRAAG